MESDPQDQVAEIESDTGSPDQATGQPGGDTRDAEADDQPKRKKDRDGRSSNNPSGRSRADVARLESQLREKEQLVTALTGRLEQAAEQLDRIHRTGGDRGLRVGGGGFPPELIQQHSDLVQDLQRAVEQWEEMQAAATLGRLELGIAELRDLFASGDVGSSLAETLQTPNSLKQSGNSRQGDSADTKSAPSSWESLKAGILAAENDQEAGKAAESRSEEPDESAELHAIPAPDVPEPIDVSTATHEQLQEAVACRDRYITYLTQRIRSADFLSADPDAWKSLENVPDELRERLHALESDLQDKLRKTEVELSLERAQIGREQARLQQQQELIEKELKRLGLPGGGGDQEGDDSDSAQSDDERQGSRWRRFLRKGNNEDDGD